MRLINKKIDDWTEPYVTIYGSNQVQDKDLKSINPVKYFLNLTQPNIFQCYAISLASYWIYETNNIQEIKVNINESEGEFPEKDYNRISWRDFYKYKNVEFDLNKAIIDAVEWKRPFGKQMNNELYCGEGLMDKEHLISFVNTVLSIYGDQEIEAFYVFMATEKYEEDELFVGKISELPHLLNNKTRPPSLIYPKEKNWLINTDFDLPFSTIGGECKLINQLVENNREEIYKVEY